MTGLKEKLAFWSDRIERTIAGASRNVLILSPPRIVPRFWSSWLKLLIQSEGMLNTGQ